MECQTCSSSQTSAYQQLQSCKQEATFPFSQLRVRVLRADLPQGVLSQGTMPIDRSKWKLDDLKAECRRRSIRIDGRKMDLIERLESYDRNDDFRGPPVDLPTAQSFPQMEMSSFKSVTIADKDIMPKVLGILCATVSWGKSPCISMQW